MKIFKIVIILILLTKITTLSEEGLVILDKSIDRFPEIETSFYYFEDDNNRPFMFLQNDELEIFDNSLTVNNFSISNPQQNLNSYISITIALDLAIEGDEANGNFELMKDITRFIIDNFNNNKSECAIMSFDQGNYLNCDFTGDSIKLHSSIQNIQNSKKSNYQSAFIKEPSNIIKTANESKSQKSVILITNKKHLNNFQYIYEQLLSDNNLTLYVLTLGNETQEDFIYLSNKTNGLSFGNIVDIENAKPKILSIIGDIYNYKPSVVKWNVEHGCELEHLVQLKVNNVSDTTKMIYDESFQSYLEFNPEFLDFSAVLAGDTKDLEVDITARNSDVIIHDLSFTNSVFTIVKGGLSQSNPTKKISQDESYKLTVRFTPTDSSLVFDSLVVGSDACKGKRVLISAGFPNTPPKERNLTILKPSCDKTLLMKDTVRVEWTGVLPKDVIQLEYSLDAGESWEVLAKNVNGLYYDWVVPENITDDVLIRAIQLWPNNVGQTMDFVHNDLVKVSNFNQLGDKVVTASLDSVVRVWNSNNGYLLQELIGHKSAINWVSFSIDEKRVISASDDSTVIIWDISNSEMKKIQPLFVLKGHTGKVNCANFSPDGKYVITASRDGKVKLWDAVTGEYKKDIISDPKSLMYCEFSRDGKFALASSNFLSIFVLKTEDWSLYRELTIYNGAILQANFSPDNSQVISSGWLGRAIMWDIESADSLFSVRHSYDTLDGTVPINSAQFDNSGEYFLTTAVDNSAKLWNSKTGELVKSLKEHRSNVVYATFNFDGSRILTSSWDSTAKIWNLNKRDLQMDTSDCNYSIREAQIDFADIDLGKVQVGTSKYFVIDSFFVNKNDYEIRIKDISVSGENHHNFELLDLEFPKELLDSVSEELYVIFKPQKSGIIEADIIIDIPGLTITKKIRGEGFEPELQAFVEQIDFGKIELEDYKDTSITIIVKNVSDKNINVNNINIAGPDVNHFFILENDREYNLAPQEAIDLSLRFIPEVLTKLSSKIVFDYSGDGEETIISLFGEGIPIRIDTATIKIGNVSGAVGDIIEIPIKVSNLSELGFRNSIESFSVNLKFNATMLEPLFPDMYSWVDGKNRIISFDIPSEFNEDSILYKAKFRVVLGNDTTTNLSIKDFRIIGKGKTNISLEDGLFVLDGYCNEGNTRLFDSDGTMVLLQNYPNPFSTSTTIDFEVFEPGVSKLYITDMLGKVVTTIVEGELSAGQYSYDLFIPEIPSGTYFYILETPNYKTTKRMEIRR